MASIAATSNAALSRRAPTVRTLQVRATVPCVAASASTGASTASSSSLSLRCSLPGASRVVRGLTAAKSKTKASPVPTIAPGKKLPEGTLSVLDDALLLEENGVPVLIKKAEVKKITVSELTEGKKVVLLTVHNALRVDNLFTAYKFVQMADALKALGVDTVACVARFPPKDAEGMRTWRKFLDAGDKVQLLVDRGNFVKALGTKWGTLRVCAVDRVVTTSGEFRGTVDKFNASEDVRDERKLIELLTLMTQGETRMRRPVRRSKKEITDQGKIPPGKLHVEGLMKEQVKEEYISKMQLDFHEKLDKVLAETKVDKSKIEDLKKKFVAKLKSKDFKVQLLI